MSHANVFSDIVLTNEALNVPMIWCWSLIQHQAPMAVSAANPSEQRYTDADDVWLRDGQSKSGQCH